MAKVQPLIPPVLMQIINRFPGRNDAVCRLFRTNLIFIEICQDYDQCCKTLRHYQRQDSEEAMRRITEYEEIIGGLEQEIMQCLDDSNEK